MSSSTNKIRFHFLEKVPALKNRTRLKSFVQQQCEKRGFTVDFINYIFCSDEYLLNYNKQYLEHNTLTDIITFQLNQTSQPLQADIYISTERVQDNAKKFKVSLQQELHRVIFHGALHLCGLKDKTQEQSVKMKEAEGQLLNLYFVSRETF